MKIGVYVCVVGSFIGLAGVLLTAACVVALTLVPIDGKSIEQLLEIQARGNSLMLVLWCCFGFTNVCVVIGKTIIKLRIRELRREISNAPTTTP